MKASGRCSNCSCTRLFVIDRVTQPAQESINTIVNFHVTTAATYAAGVGLDDDNPYRAAIGSFEIWVCSSCGLTEWYARDANRALELLAKMGTQGVRIVEQPSSGPFR